MGRISNTIVERFHKAATAMAVALWASTVAVGATMGAAEAREPYRLGAGDTVGVKIVEWRSGAGEYFEWAALNGDYRVGAGGRLALPLLGAVAVEGMTLDEASSLIADQLKQQIRLLQAPFVSLQIEEYRPIYVIGDVASAGAHAYRPGLTALQSVALAGGYADGDAGVDAAQSARVAGKLETLTLELRRALLRRARLTAALAGDAELRVPDDLTTQDAILDLLEREQSILTAERRERDASLGSIQEQKRLEENEIAALEAKQILAGERVERMQVEQARVQDLKDRKLTVTSTVLIAETRLANAKRELLDIDVSLFKSKQDLARLNLRGDEILSEERAAHLADLQKTEAEIETLRAEIQTNQAVLGEARSAEIAALMAGESVLAPVFEVRRRGPDGTIATLVGDEDTELVPGDTVQVSRRPAGGDDS